MGKAILAWVIAPAVLAAGYITLDPHSVADGDATCIQVPAPFERSVDLGSYPSGSYILVFDRVEYPFTI